MLARLQEDSVLLMSNYRSAGNHGEGGASGWRRQSKYSRKYKKYFAKADDIVLIDFEGNGVPQNSANPEDNQLSFSPSYQEDGFVLSAIQSEGAVFPPLGITLADINISAPDISPGVNKAVNQVSQYPGRTVGTAEEPESDLVISRSDGNDFEFKGGFFGFAGISGFIDGVGFLESPNTQETIRLTFKGYRNGKLVDSFSSKIPPGGFIRSKIHGDIDTLVIEDGDLLGFALADNLVFEI
jgi:hypothetical protein